MAKVTVRPLRWGSRGISWIVTKTSPKPAVLQPYTMYDSITVANLPAGAKAYAGYVGGYWPTFFRLKALFLRRKVVSIAVNADEDADVLDIERGDATAAQASAWVKRQHMRGKKNPGVYTSLANAAALIDVLAKSGWRYGIDYQMWTAHYTGAAHLCGPECGYGLTVHAHATQYASNPRYDTSLCTPHFQ